MTQVNREYKDNKAWTLSLYNAVNEAALVVKVRIV